MGRASVHTPPQSPSAGGDFYKGCQTLPRSPETKLILLSE